MRELRLRPYPGKLHVCYSKEEYRREHKKLFGCDIDLGDRCGRMDGDGKKFIYLVWGKNRSYLAHEIAHVVLHVFELAGIDPRDANGEPFCYMLSQLLLEA